MASSVTIALFIDFSFVPSERFEVAYIYCKSRAKTAFLESFFGFLIISRTYQLASLERLGKKCNFCLFVDTSCRASSITFRCLGVQSLQTAL